MNSKRLLSPLFIVALLFGTLFANGPAETKHWKLPNPISLVKPTVYLKNNSLIPRKVTIISQGPLSRKEKMETVWMLPGQKISRSYILKTKIYIPSKEQMSILKEEGCLAKSEPFMKVQFEDRNQIFKLYE